MNETVDIFIPTHPGNERTLPAALCSALTQTYQPIRVILWIDGVSDRIDQVLAEWWYTDRDVGAYEEEVKWKDLTLTYEHCHKGILVRHIDGPSGSAHNARQWLFEYEGLSRAVKMLDSDDVIVPVAIERMMKYLTPETDAVFCPILKTSSLRFAEILNTDLSRGPCGSGTMLLTDRMMKRMIVDGFEWPKRPGHDRGFYEFMQKNQRYKEYNIAQTTETALYLYLR